MKTNELRIGNWYNEFGIPKQITPDIIYAMYKIEKSGKVAIDVSPIPLTEEWLVKFGFENSKAKSAKKWIFYASFNHHYNSGLMKVHLTGGSVIISGKRIFCKHVHQLQNLYFALTGEELEVK
jgi:hypothetical protein